MPLGLFIKKYCWNKVVSAGYDILFAYFVVEAPTDKTDGFFLHFRILPVAKRAKTCFQKHFSTFRTYIKIIFRIQTRYLLYKNNNFSSRKHTISQKTYVGKHKRSWRTCFFNSLFWQICILSSFHSLCISSTDTNFS